MHDSPKACPVSGEIMTDAAATTARRRGPARNGSRDIVEAEFETVRPDAPLHGFRGPRAEAPKGIEFLRKRPDLRGNKRTGRFPESEKGGSAAANGRSAFVFWMAGAALVTMVFLFSGGFVLVGGTRLGLPAATAPSDSFHTAGIPDTAAGSKAHGGSPAAHFLGTSAGHSEAQGSFVFSDQLEAPKDKEPSASISFSEEE